MDERQRDIVNVLNSVLELQRIFSSCHAMIDDVDLRDLKYDIEELEKYSKKSINKTRICFTLNEINRRSENILNKKDERDIGLDKIVEELKELQSLLMEDLLIDRIVDIIHT